MDVLSARITDAGSSIKYVSNPTWAIVSRDCVDHSSRIAITVRERRVDIVMSHHLKSQMISCVAY